MMNKYLVTLLVLVCCLSSLLAQDSTPIVKHFAGLEFTVEAAPQWTNLFKRTKGWFGADGIFSIPLSGNDLRKKGDNDSVLLLFSDTYIGEVKEGKPLKGNTMVNNSIAYIRRNNPELSNIHFLYKKDKEGHPATFFVPESSTKEHPQLFWLGDGFVNKELNNTLYLFGYKVERTGPGVFDFKESAVSILSIPKNSQPPFAQQRQTSTPLHVVNSTLGEGNFGAGILVNTTWAGSASPDGYVYVYGCLGKDKNLVVAKVKPTDFENLSAWLYWNGKTWTPDINDLGKLTNAVSDELSVTALPDGRFILVFQVLGLSDKVGIRIGESPVGPFSDIQEIWTTPEWKQGLWTYNAKAHPSLSAPGELLISYNTITPDFWNDIQKDAFIYRPRFIKLTFKIK